MRVYERIAYGTLLKAKSSGVSWIPKWRCGIVLLPLLPTLPGRSPAFTVSPTFGTTDPGWKCPYGA